MTKRRAGSVYQRSGSFLSSVKPVVTSPEPDGGTAWTRGRSRWAIASYERTSSNDIGGTGDGATKDESRTYQLDFTIMYSRPTVLPFSSTERRRAANSKYYSKIASRVSVSRRSTVACPENPTVLPMCHEHTGVLSSESMKGDLDKCMPTNGVVSTHDAKVYPKLCPTISSTAWPRVQSESWVDVFTTC